MVGEHPVQRPDRKPDETRAATSVDVHVGQRLRAQRVSSGMSQEQLAARLGVSFQQLQKYERGVNRLSASRLHHAASVLKVSILWFFDGLPGGARETQANAENGPTINNPEVLRFVQAVRRISDPNRRRQFRNLASALAAADDR